ncbi:hypothetical protein [Roseibium album]|uniref:hypothetical protein n=1 Tax=Roseibium album TaxID=311410 RepID=UPI002493C00B|nr:hypothetical protein [Roseibium album]
MDRSAEDQQNEKYRHLHEPLQINILDGFYGVDFSFSPKNERRIDELVQELRHIGYARTAGSAQCDFLSRTCVTVYTNYCVTLVTYTLPARAREPDLENVDLWPRRAFDHIPGAGLGADAFSTKKIDPEDLNERTAIARIIVNWKPRIESKDFANFSADEEFNASVFRLFHNRWANSGFLTPSGEIFEEYWVLKDAINGFGQRIFDQPLCLELGRCRIHIVNDDTKSEEYIEFTFFNATIDYFFRPNSPENGEVFRFSLENPGFLENRITKVDRVPGYIFKADSHRELNDEGEWVSAHPEAMAVVQASYERLIARLIAEEGLSECERQNAGLDKIQHLNLSGAKTRMKQSRQLFFACPFESQYGDELIRDVKVDVDFSFGLNLWAPGSIGYLDIRDRKETVRQFSDGECVRGFCLGHQYTFIRDSSYRYQGYFGEQEIVWFRNSGLTANWFGVGAKNTTSPVYLIAGSLCNDAAGECALWTGNSVSGDQCSSLEERLGFFVECVRIMIIGVTRVIEGRIVGDYEIGPQRDVAELIDYDYEQISSKDLWGGMAPTASVGGAGIGSRVFIRREETLETLSLADRIAVENGDRELSRRAHFVGISNNLNVSQYPFEGVLDTAGLFDFYNHEQR